MAKQTTNYKIFLQSKQAERGFARLNTKALAVAGAFAGAAAVVVGVGAAIVKLTEHATKHAEAQARLAATVEATGQKLTFNVKLINDHARALSELSGVTRDQVITGTAMLTSFNLTDEAVAELMPAMADLSSFMGNSMKDSALLLGKAMTTGASALTRVGVTLDDTQKAALNASTGIDRAAKLAEILGKNFGGAAAKINNADQGFANLKVALDEALIPLSEVVRVGVAEWAVVATSAVKELTSAFKEYFELDGSQAAKFNQVNTIAEKAEVATKKIKSLKRTLETVEAFGFDENATGQSAVEVARMFGFIAKSGEDVGDVMFRARFEVQRIAKDLKDLKGDTDKINTSVFGGGKVDAKDPEADAKAAAARKIAATKAAANAKAARIVREREEERARVESLEKADRHDQRMLARSAARQSAERNRREQNKAIEIEAKEFGIKIEKEKQEKLFAIEKERYEKRKELADIALEEQRQRTADNINIAQNSAGIAIGIAQQLANDIATGQENAAERALAAALTQYGGQLVGLGTKAAFEGGAMLIASGGTDPRGYGLVALGGAAIAAGVGMGAAGAAVNSSISGGSSTSQNNATGGASISGSATSTNGNVSTGSEDGKQTIIINSNAPIFGDIRPTLNSWSRAKRKSERFSLRTV